jgi:hypothetical protein
MGTYLFAHHFPRGFQGSPETAAAAVAWFEQLAPNLAGRTDRSAEPRRLGDSGADPEATAFELVTADDLEAAAAQAAAWPLLARGGEIEVWALTTEKFSLPVPTPAGAR